MKDLSIDGSPSSGPTFQLPYNVRREARDKGKPRTIQYTPGIWRTNASLLEHPPTRLPIEIWERMIDCYGSDTEVLYRFGLVCKAWLPRTRYHLWSTLTIAPDQGMPRTRYSRAWTNHLIPRSALAVSPARAQYTRRLVFTDCPTFRDALSLPALDEKLQDLEELSLGNFQWENCGILKENLLKHFNGIQILRFHGGAMGDVSKSVQLLSSFPKITTLELSGVAIHPRSLSSFNTGATVLQGSFPELRRFNLRLYRVSKFPQELLAWFASEERFPQLSEIEVLGITKGFIPVVSAFLRATGPRIRYLSLGFSVLSTGTNGKRLAISFPHLFVSHVYDPSALWLTFRRDLDQQYPIYRNSSIYRSST